MPTTHKSTARVDPVPPTICSIALLTASLPWPVADWMRSNRLQLNTGKTEFLWCTSAHHQHQLPTDQLAVGIDLLSPVSFLRDLGIYVDSDLWMRTHVLRMAGRCFAVLRQICSIRRSVTRPVLESLVVSLVVSPVASPRGGNCGQLPPQPSPDSILRSSKIR